MANDDTKNATLERLKEAMTLEARQHMTAVVNGLGEKWAKAPVTGKEKALAILRAFGRAEMGLAMVYKNADLHKPEDWMKAPELAVECAEVVCEQLKRELEIIDEGHQYTVTITKTPKLEMPT
jgi:hypothetical protein